MKGNYRQLPGNRAPTLRDRLRRGLAALFRLGLLAAAVAVLAAVGVGLQRLYVRLDVPIALIGVDGGLTHISRAEVEEIVAANLQGGFLSLDLEAIRGGLEKHPWVASASARRQWPNELVIIIEEETPIARWGSSGFLNNQGQVLEIDSVEQLGELPLLAGPPGTEREVMRQYRTFAQLLLPTGLKIDVFRLGVRGNWDLTFEQGPTLAAGRGQVTEKLQRFLLVWERHLKTRLDEIESVDIRYGNGVAVGWKTTAERDA